MNQKQTIPLIQKIRRLNADLDTPISLFLSITEDNKHAIMLESAKVDGKWGRYSVIATDFLMTACCKNGNLSLTINDSQLSSLSSLNGLPFIESLREIIQRLDFSGNDRKLPPITRALYGYFGYESVVFFQKKLKDCINSDHAEACLALPGTILLFDHLYNSLSQISIGEHRSINTRISHHASPPIIGKITCQPDKGDYIKNVEKIRALIHEGEAIQVVFSTRSSATFDGDPFALYRKMRIQNPSPYMFFMRLPEICLFGSSPELLVKCSDGALQVSPIAGTRKRGEDEIEDTRLATELLQDPKERAEHTMLVDLGRNDLGSIAKPGSVKVEKLMEVERFSHVMHMTSRVTGHLNPDLDALDIMKSVFPAGTVSGAPKTRAMEIISEMESLPRGPYAGCIGWIGLDHNAVHMDSGITIRSMWVRDGRLHWQTGAGIVSDSDPEAEWNECLNKGKIINTILKEEDHVSINR